MKYYETKIGKIIAKEFDARMELAVFNYIMSNGIDNVKTATDEEIAKVEGNGLMTAGFCQALVKCAREICLQCEFIEIIEYIRLHLHCIPAVHELTIYRDDCSQEAFDEILSELNLDDEQVENSVSVYAVVDESTLKEL